DDVGILRHWQREHRDAADHHHQDGEHVRKYGPRDEKIGNHMPLLSGAGRAGRRRSSSLELRIDLLTRDGTQNSGNNDPIVRFEPTLDHTEVADFGSDRDLALFDDVLLVEHEQVTSALVATERGIWYQQRIVLVGGANAHAHEIA